MIVRICHTIIQVNLRVAPIARERLLQKIFVEGHLLGLKEVPRATQDMFVC